MMNFMPLYSRERDPVTQSDPTLCKIPYIVTYRILPVLGSQRVTGSHGK